MMILTYACSTFCTKSGSYCGSTYPISKDTEYAPLTMWVSITTKGQTADHNGNKKQGDFHSIFH